MLASEAFKLAGDANAFPEQLREGLTPWQPKRILIGRGGRAGAGGSVRMDIGGNDPLTGESFASIASRSRAMHKTQGFGQGGGGAGGGRGGGSVQTFTLLDGAPATDDLMDGIDTTWSRVPGGADVGRLTNDAMAAFNDKDPAASVPALLAIRAKATALPRDPVIADKLQLLDRIIAECLGLTVQTTVANAEIVPGETVRLHHAVSLQSSMPVRWTAVRYPTLKREVRVGAAVRAGQRVVRDTGQTIPLTTPLTQPYWLREEASAGMFRVREDSLIGRPESPPALPVDYVFDIAGQTLIVPDEPVAASAADAPIEKRRTLAIISPAPMRFASNVALFAPGSAHQVAIELTASRANVAGTVQLNAPAAWKVAPATQSFRISAVGGKTRVTFSVTAPATADRATITAQATINGSQYSTERDEIAYDHIPFQLLQSPARLKAVSLALVTRGKNVGYVPGAGDEIPQALEQMGFSVTTITGADATPARLHALDAVVIGIRAFNVRSDLDVLMPALFAYAEGGGTVIEQYNQTTGLRSTNFAPYRLQLSSSDRVTEENSPVTFLAPDHPALNTPNKITSADFDGWVQERGTYFPSQWDSHFVPILSMKDSTDPAPYQGSLLVAKYGKGYFVYTGIVFFRELPAGVPGAYRLFANLISLGQSGIVP